MLCGFLTEAGREQEKWNNSGSARLLMFQSRNLKSLGKGGENGHFKPDRRNFFLWRACEMLVIVSSRSLNNTVLRWESWGFSKVCAGTNLDHSPPRALHNFYQITSKFFTQQWVEQTNPRDSIGNSCRVCFLNHVRAPRTVLSRYEPLSVTFLTAVFCPPLCQFGRTCTFIKCLQFPQ